jgi:hypothetical protein
MGYDDDEPFSVSYCFSNSQKSERNSLEDDADYQGIIAFFQAHRRNANPVQVIILDNNVRRFQFHIYFNNHWIYSFCRQIHLWWEQVIPVRQARKPSRLPKHMRLLVIKLTLTKSLENSRDRILFVEITRCLVGWATHLEYMYNSRR